MTAKAQVQEAIDNGLSQKQAIRKLKKIPKGTVSAYYSTLKRQQTEATPIVVTAPLPKVAEKAKFFTKFELIDKIMDADLVNHQKKVFVKMVMEL